MMCVLKFWQNDEGQIERDLVAANSLNGGPSHTTRNRDRTTHSRVIQTGHVGVFLNQDKLLLGPILRYSSTKGLPVVVIRFIANSRWRRRSLTAKKFEISSEPGDQT